MTSQAPDSWSQRRLSAALGAEITGIQLNTADAEDIQQVKALLLEHQVLFFPGQNLSVDEHVTLGRHFGVLEAHPNLGKDEQTPASIFRLTASKGGIADEWHTDITFQKQPAKMSILNMKQCPEVGGDTMWTNLYRAYEALSEPMQTLCRSLSALHDAHPHNHPEQTAIHPVVRVHPETGLPVLYVNEHFTRRIVEMSATESEMLLNYLTRFVASPRFTLRYQWQPGTICMWDNRCTQHFVLNDFEGERVIERVTIMGDEVHAFEESTLTPYTRAGALSATSRHDRQLYFHLHPNPS
ncbi:TauD/TfdA family dioxygenase [Pseudomonadales bacterium]|nr:TauD/TfdA family dioxygenase [Pseudomonadales bacterium]